MEISGQDETFLENSALANSHFGDCPWNHLRILFYYRSGRQMAFCG